MAVGRADTYDQRAQILGRILTRNRVVDASKLFTYPHGQIPPENALLFGAETAIPGGSAEVSFDDIVLDKARVR